MKLSVKQVVFILFGLAVAIATFVFMQQNVATAAKKDGKKFEDWIVSCSPANEEKNTPEICLLSQQLNLNKDDKQQVIATFQIGYLGKDKLLQIIETLPLGVNIPAGTSVISSKKLIIPGTYTTCMPGGCQAMANISEEHLKELITGTDSAVAFLSIDGKQVTLPLSTKGLEKGLDYIK